MNRTVLVEQFIIEVQLPITTKDGDEWQILPFMITTTRFSGGYRLARLNNLIGKRCKFTIYQNQQFIYIKDKGDKGRIVYRPNMIASHSTNIHSSKSFNVQWFMVWFIRPLDACTWAKQWCPIVIVYEPVEIYISFDLPKPHITSNDRHRFGDPPEEWARITTKQIHLSCHQWSS